MDVRLSAWVEEVRAEIQVRGWIQGNYRTGRGVCLLGAIEDVSDQKGVLGLRGYLTEAIANTIRARTASAADMAETVIVRWNDTGGRTYEEVDALLARLAAATAVPVVTEVIEEEVCV